MEERGGSVDMTANTTWSEMADQAIKTGDTKKLALLLNERGAEKLVAPLEVPLMIVATCVTENGLESMTECVRLLLEAGADPNVEFLSQTTCSLAAENGNWNLVDLLERAGADLSLGFDTPAYWAARQGMLEKAVELSKDEHREELWKGVVVRYLTSSRKDEDPVRLENMLTRLADLGEAPTGDSQICRDMRGHLDSALNRCSDFVVKVWVEKGVNPAWPEWSKSRERLENMKAIVDERDKLDSDSKPGKREGFRRKI